MLTVSLNPSKIITASFQPVTGPQITQQPLSQTVLAGTTATLSVTASGEGPLDYQWGFGGTNLAGATNAALTLANVRLNQAGSYRVVVSNAGGVVTSSPATLTVRVNAVVSLPSATPANGHFGLTLSPEPHRAYWLEYKTNLTQASWTVLAGFTNVSGPQVLLDSTATNRTRFYRLGSAPAP